MSLHAHPEGDRVFRYHEGDVNNESGGSQGGDEYVL
jgi:hypothetical protein